VILFRKEIITGLMAIAIGLFGCAESIAQNTGAIITSNPPGAAITLDGEYKLSATTPCRLPDNVTGRFTLKATMPGYESWKGDIVIIPGQENKYSFGLSPKTRAKAAVRSLFMPGWGQYYSGQTTRAYVVNITTLGFGIGTIIADYDFRQKRDDYKQAQADLDNATSYEEISRLRQLVFDKNRDAYDAETTRNTFAIITAALWAYNVLDALVFFPENKLYFHQGGLPVKEAAIEPEVSLKKIGVKLTATF
jgi:hypothetical protein